MRPTLYPLLLAVVVSPLAAQDQLDWLKRRGVAADDIAFSARDEQTYVPIRPGELRSASFLTEGRAMPFGTVLGVVTPSQVQVSESGTVAYLRATIAIRPPAGASYQRGDTVLLAVVMPGPRGFGEVVIPTGLARVGESQERQTLAEVVAVYGPIRDGQVTLPVDPITKPAAVVPVKASGPSGEVISSETPRELQQPSGRMFITIGSGAGLRTGDFVEVRRRPGPRVNASDTIDELMAVGQVVRVNEKSSTIKLTRIMAPDIPPGTPVVRVATLPN